MPLRIEAKLGVLVLGLGISLASASTASAASTSGALGYAHYQGSENNVNRALIAEATVSLPRAEASLVGLHYDDDVSGSGLQILAGAGVPLGPAVVLRALGGPVVGEGDYRAWRAKAGPQFNLSRIAALQVSYLRYQDNQDFHSDGIALESATVLSSRLTGRLSGSYAATSLGLNSSQGGAGLSWVAVPHLELSGELGVARNGGLASSGNAGPPPLIPPLLGPGGGGTPGASDEVSPTYQLAVRLLFP